MLSSLILGVAIPLQAVLPSDDSTYASARVRRLVEEAAAVCAHPPSRLASFTAHVETGISVLVRRADGDEVQVQVEQVAGRVAWRRDGTLGQTVTGYRARTLGLTFSTLSFLRTPWVVAPIYGDRVPLVLAQDSTVPAGPQPRVRVPQRLVNPFASDRAEYYRFSGGDTVLTLHLPKRTVHVVRVMVEPVRVPRDAMVFRGEVDLDAALHEVVRAHGQILGKPRKSSLATRLVNATMEGYFFVDLENAEWEGSFWLPHRQWIEVEAKPGFADERAVFRMVTDFSSMDVDAPVPGPDSASSRGGPRRTLRIEPMDSLRGFTGWHRELGAATAEVDAPSFSDVAPDELGPGGPVRARFGTSAFSQALRYDRVEGLFTGTGATLDFGDAAPGAYVNAHAGYAWAERTVRGAVDIGRRWRWWNVGVTAGRRLASTNDFPPSFGARPSLLGLFGTDDFDYVDRYAAEVHLGIFDRSGDDLELRAGAVRDRAPSVHILRAPLGRRRFLPLRPVEEGAYRHLLVEGNLGGNAGGEYMTPGFSGGASWELARGGLDWQRVEGFVRERAERGRWTWVGDVYGGAVLAHPPPPQELFELGGWAGRLPGFAYKAFTGDRAVVGALQIMYTLPLLNAPLRLGRLFLPAVAPAPSMEVHAGWAGASASTARLLNSFGWKDSEGVRATLFLGLRFFGGALSLGVARPLGERGPWRIEGGTTPGG